MRSIQVKINYTYLDIIIGVTGLYGLISTFHNNRVRKGVIYVRLGVDFILNLKVGVILYLIFNIWFKCKHL